MTAIAPIARREGLLQHQSQRSGSRECRQHHTGHQCLPGIWLWNDIRVVGLVLLSLFFVFFEEVFLIEGVSALVWSLDMFFVFWTAMKDIEGWENGIEWHCHGKE